MITKCCDRFKTQFYAKNNGAISAQEVPIYQLVQLEKKSSPPTVKSPRQPPVEKHVPCSTTNVVAAITEGEASHWSTNQDASGTWHERSGVIQFGAPLRSEDVITPPPEDVSPGPPEVIKVIHKAIQTMKREQDGEKTESMWILWDEDHYDKFKVVNITTAKLKQRGSQKYIILAVLEPDFKSARVEDIATAEINKRFRGDAEERSVDARAWAGCGRAPQAIKHSLGRARM